MPVAPLYPQGAYPDLEPFFETLRRDMQLRRFTQRIPYASSITPDANRGEIVVVDTLTGDLTVANPVNASSAMRLYFSFTQDDTGGHTVTFGSDFLTSWGTIEDANATSTVDFWYNEVVGKWIQGSDMVATSSGSLPSVITQLITFDRDPNPPFAVSSNSGVVTALDSDLLDGQHGVYYRDAGNLNAGTLLDARVAESNVTQHEAALSIGAAQITAGTFGTGAYVFDNTVSGITTLTATTLAGTLSTVTQNSVTTMTGLTTVGTLVGGAVPASLVTAGSFGTGAYVFDSTVQMGGLTATTGTFTGLVLTPASVTGSAGLRVPHGTAPTTPVNGDLWTTATSAYVRISGVTQDLLAGGGAVSSVSGTANRITCSPTTGAVVVDIHTSYVGQATITTLGTIATGVWNGTTIATANTVAKVQSVAGGTGITSTGGETPSLSVDASQTQITAVGTLGGLTVTATITGSITGNAGSASSVTWTNVSGKPSTFTPTAHGAASHTGTIGAWGDISGKPTTFTPITHGSAYHTGTIGGWTQISGKPSTFPPSSHSHATGDITSGTFISARLSGTYTININGNASSASSVTWANVSGKPSTFTPISHGSSYHTGTIGSYSQVSGTHGSGDHSGTIGAFSQISGSIASSQVSGSYTSITGVGALNAGSITSGFGDIDNGNTSSIKTWVYLFTGNYNTPSGQTATIFDQSFVGPTVSGGGFQVRTWDIASMKICAWFRSGQVLGAPTGADKGRGTLNVALNIYKNGGSPLFDYVFDYAFTGACTMLGYTGLMSLADELRHARDFRCLHLIPAGEGVGLFDQTQGMGAQLEEAYLHLFDHEDRIAVLERENKELKEQIQQLAA